MDAPGPSSASHQQGTSTPIDEDDNTTPVTEGTLNISPIMTTAHPSPAQKKSNKKSPKLTQRGKRSSIRKKATVSAARKTANMKLTNAKLAALKQSYVFNLSQSPINMDELGKKKTTRFFTEHSPGHSKPFIIAASSSAADFMISTPTRSTDSTIAKSPPLRNINKIKAEATVKKLHVEKTTANLASTLPIDDSPQQTNTKDTTIIDLADTSDEPQQSTTLSINPNCSSFGQDIVILSSDSQDSSPSFHTASVHSVSTRTLLQKNPTPMDWSSTPQDPEREPHDHATKDNASSEEAQH